MTYNDYRTHILTCEYLGKEPAGQYKKVHDFLMGVWDGMEVVVDSRYDRTVLQKGEWFFIQDQKNGDLLCQYARVWSFFRNDMGMEYPVTQDFIKSVVEEHLKCVVGTPEGCSIGNGLHGGRTSQMCGGNTLLPDHQHR